MNAYTSALKTVMTLFSTTRYQVISTLYFLLFLALAGGSVGTAAICWLVFTWVDLLVVLYTLNRFPFLQVK